jgi:phospholipid transport system substrate-binding protein
MRLTNLLVASTWMTAGVLHANLVCAQANALANTIPAATAATSTTQQTPSDIIQSAAQRTLNELQSNRDAYRKDPSKVRPLVDKYLLPHFDTQYAARLVLGQYWRTASCEHRKRFIDAFYYSLLTNYGRALVELTPDRLRVFPITVDPSADHATVRTEVAGYSANRIAMNYSMHKTPEGWKAYDLTVDGISYIKSYRVDFGAQIQHLGLDSLIARLEEAEKPAGGRGSDIRRNRLRDVTVSSCSRGSNCGSECLGPVWSKRDERREHRSRGGRAHSRATPDTHHRAALGHSVAGAHAVRPGTLA